VSDVAIHYTRPPDRVTVFRQHLVHRASDCIVTLMPRTPLQRTATVGDTIILEPGSPIVWFTFPGAWHDIGRFHTAAGEFTGFYANLLTPVQLLSDNEWKTTDLFLDVWLGTAGDVHLLDEDEFDDAIAQRLIDLATATAARQDAERLVQAARAATWPPAIAHEWTLERARDAVRHSH
jgi:predicted RNA-binding protein associated with RNAse of E/G family